jgi:CBS domain containing-hemolysin-like protein
MITDILLTSLLVLMNAFFVAAEFSIVKVRASQIELRIRNGSKLAELAKKLVQNLDGYLSATQLGITLTSLALGWIGEPIVSKIIIKIFEFFSLNIDPGTAHDIALPAAFITITFLHIVFGELAPKSMAIQRPEQVSMVIALPLRIFYLVFNPFIWVLNTIANLIIRLFGFEIVSDEAEQHSEEELRLLLEAGTKSGVIDQTEHKLLENVFDFSDTPIRQIMVPRNRIEAVDINMNPEKIMEKFIDEGYSRMPVYDDQPDNIKGIIYAKDIITMIWHPDLILIHDLIRPAYFVNEDDKISKLLSDMQRMKIHVAMVLDEFGGLAGMVTLEDIIEEIFGEIQDEYDEESPIVEKSGNYEYIVAASANIDDANEFLPVPLPESDDYETVGGLIINTTGTIPEQNETIEIDNYICTIIKRSDRLIETLRLTVKELPNQ